MIRDKPEHIRRRRIWDRGFSAKGQDSPSTASDPADTL